MALVRDMLEVEYLILHQPYISRMLCMTRGVLLSSKTLLAFSSVLVWPFSIDIKGGENLDGKSCSFSVDYIWRSSSLIGWRFTSMPKGGCVGIVVLTLMYRVAASFWTVYGYQPHFLDGGDINAKRGVCRHCSVGIDVNRLLVLLVMSIYDGCSS